MARLDNLSPPPLSQGAFTAPRPAVHRLTASQHTDRRQAGSGAGCAPELHACPAADAQTYRLCWENVFGRGTPLDFVGQKQQLKKCERVSQVRNEKGPGKEGKSLP